MHASNALLAIIAAALAAFLCTPRALAQEAPAPAAPALSGNVAVVSDYLFRGLSQTGQAPALQAGIEYGSADGGYVGAWGSNVSWLSDLSTPAAHVSNRLEVDLYAGWRIPIAGEWKVDFGLYTYYYPGDYPRGFTRPYTTEAYVGIGWSIATLKYSHAFTNAFGFADSRHSDYLDLSANWGIAPTWVLNAHVGRQRIKHSAAADYTDWKIGVTKNLANGFSVALGWYDTNADEAVYTNPDDENLGRATGVLALAKTF